MSNFYYKDIGQENYTGIVNPTVNDDSNSGFIVGDIWTNTVTKVTFVLLSATIGAAQWVKINNANISATDPLVTHDAVNGYSVGSMWINSTSNISYISVEDNTGAAVWKRTSVVKNNVSTINPTIGDDNTLGYEIGSIWTNSLSKKMFIATSVGAGAAVWLKINEPRISAINPTINDDLTNNNPIGTLWINTTTDQSYVSVDETNGAAVWKRISIVKNNVTTVNPTVGDDILNGYEIGSLWHNIISSELFIATSVGTGAAVWLKINRPHIAAVNPTVTDDASTGYTLGSIWINTATDQSYVSVDETNGAAVWKRISAVKNHITNTSPTVGDDTSLGYEVGSTWTNTLSNELFIATGVSVGAAVWLKINKAVTSATNPLVTDDLAAGRPIGTLWINTTTDQSYVSVDETNGAAVWKRISAVKHNVALVNPVVTDDTTGGYEIGSLWYNSLSSQMFIAISVGTGAAVWSIIGGPHIALVNPTATDDVTTGRTLGSIWVNTVLDLSFICVDDTATAAVWQPLTGPNKISYSTTTLPNHTINDLVANLSTGLGSLNYLLPFAATIGQSLSVVKTSDDDNFIDIGTDQIYIQNDSVEYRFDGTTWVNTKKPIGVFTGATDIAAGKPGFVKRPAIGEHIKYLKGNGNWEYADNPYIGPVINSNSTVGVGLTHVVDSSGGPITLTVLSGILSGSFVVCDAMASAGTNNIIIDFATNGYKLHGATGDNYVLNSARASVEFIYIDAIIGWIIKGK